MESGAYDYGEIVLRGIVSGDHDRVLRSLQRLSPEHFQGQQRKVFSLLTKYLSDYGRIPRGEVLADIAQRLGADVGTALGLTERFEGFGREPPAEDEYQYALDALVDARQAHLTGESITIAMEILENGAEVDGERVRGHGPARAFAYRAFSEIDRLAGHDAAPQGLLRDEGDALLQQYIDARDSSTPNGLLTGLPTPDKTIGGFRNGELVLVCGTAAAGKSMFVTQLAWRSATSGKNVVYFTIENVRSQVLNRIVARHSAHLSGSEGLDSSAIRDGRLDGPDEQLFARTVSDLVNGAGIGNLYVAQVPHGTTLGVIESRVRWLEQLWAVDVVIIDYLVLLRPDRPRPTKREELNDILQETKLMAVSLGGGRGVPVVSPWQINRIGHRDANRTGEYLLQDLAETSEAERTADQVWALLQIPDESDLRLQILKNRDGPIPEAVRLEKDFRCSLLREPEAFDVGKLLMDF